MITLSSWVLPPVFAWLQSVANLPQNELLRTFNSGIGMILIVDASEKDSVLASLRAQGEDPLVLGNPMITLIALISL